MSVIRVVIWTVAAVAIAVGVYLIADSSSSGYTVVAEFRDVDGLRQGATVKVGGVAAGIVSQLVVAPPGPEGTAAIATLTLDKGAVPIGAGASVQVRPTDLLGEHYAQLNVGNLSKPQPSGTFIPLSRTSTPVELDQVLDMLNVNVRTRLRILINEAGVALDGQGANFNELLAELPSNLSQAQTMLGQVATEDTTLQHLIDAGDEVTTAVDAKRNDMGRLISTGEAAMHSVALRQAQLSDTLDDAPSALSQLRTTLTALDGTSAAIIPAAKELQSTATPLTATLKQLPPLAKAADPTLLTAESRRSPGTRHRFSASLIHGRCAMPSGSSRTGRSVPRAATTSGTSSAPTWRSTPRSSRRRHPHC
jgi:phospholipid/cholesterol/gamma-HCH transport system substrate-binding protein